MSLSPSSDNGFRDSSSVGSYNAGSGTGDHGSHAPVVRNSTPNVRVSSSSPSYDNSWLSGGPSLTPQELMGAPLSYTPMTYPELSNVHPIDYDMWTNAMNSFLSQNTPQQPIAPSSAPAYPSVWQGLGSGQQMSPTMAGNYQELMQPYTGYHYGSANIPSTNVFNLPGIDYSAGTQAMASGGQATTGNDAVSNALRLIK